MKRYVAITGPKDIAPNIFTSKYVLLIAEEMDNPNTHFLITDAKIGILAHKYLTNRKYQNYTVYYAGEIPKITSNHNIKFTSYIEAEEALRQNSDVIIEI